MINFLFLFLFIIIINSCSYPDVDSVPDFKDVLLTDDEIYDYKNKYLKIAKHEINPRLPKKILNLLISISENIHNKMNCNCVSRLDFRYSEENEKIFLHIFYLLLIILYAHHAKIP